MRGWGGEAGLVLEPMDINGFQKRLNTETAYRSSNLDLANEISAKFRHGVRSEAVHHAERVYRDCGRIFS